MSRVMSRHAVLPVDVVRYVAPGVARKAAQTTGRDEKSRTVVVAYEATYFFFFFFSSFMPFDAAVAYSAARRASAPPRCLSQRYRAYVQFKGRSCFRSGTPLPPESCRRRELVRAHARYAHERAA